MSGVRLPSNFEEETGVEFSIENALEQLYGLEEDGADKAREYIKNTPKKVSSPLRKRVLEDPWFNKEAD